MTIPTLAEADSNPSDRIERNAGIGARFIELYDSESHSGENSLSDLLADLMHYADTLPDDDGAFEDALDSARSNYEAEKAEAAE